MLGKTQRRKGGGAGEEEVDPTRGAAGAGEPLPPKDFSGSFGLMKRFVL